MLKGNRNKERFYYIFKEAVLTFSKKWYKIYKNNKGVFYEEGKIGGIIGDGVIGGFGFYVMRWKGFERLLHSGYGQPAKEF